MRGPRAPIRLMRLVELRGASQSGLKGAFRCRAPIQGRCHIRRRVGILVDDVFKALLSNFESPVLTQERVRLAYAVAVTTDVLQLLLGPFGWAGADELLDVAAMLLTWRLIGFHPLLLPTFALELLPVADMLPTWTGCVAIVVAVRKHQQARMPPPPVPGPFIDV